MKVLASLMMTLFLLVGLTNTTQATTSMESCESMSEAPLLLPPLPPMLLPYPGATPPQVLPGGTTQIYRTAPITGPRTVQVCWTKDGGGNQAIIDIFLVDCKDKEKRKHIENFNVSPATGVGTGNCVTINIPPGACGRIVVRVRSIGGGTFNFTLSAT